MSLIEHFFSLIAPDDCLRCGREGLLVCKPCLPQLAQPNGRCFGCHRLVGVSGCLPCLAQRNLDEVRAATAYSNEAKQLVAKLKFSGNQSAARIMAEVIWHSCSPITPGTVLVPLPATTAHVRQRGFDQAQLIARHLSRLSGLPQQSVLGRAGQQHQLGAGRGQRLVQLTHSLHIRRQPPARVLLVDDVLTTGATLHAAATLLRAHGAQSITAVTFAQTASFVTEKAVH